MDARTWKLSPGLISEDIAELLRGVLKTALDFAMEPLLSTLSVVDAEAATVEEADENLSGGSVVVDSTENETIDACSVEGNSA